MATHMFQQPTSPNFFEIRMTGSADIPHPAERAKVHVTVSSSGTNKFSVTDQVITTTRHIEAHLAKLSPKDQTPEAKAASALAHWSKSSLSSTSHIPYSSGKVTKPRQYDSSVVFDIRFRDFKALGVFASQMAAVPHVEVGGIQWLLTRATRESFQSRLRKDAARDALRKAAEYCEVLDCHNLRAIELEEGNATTGVQASALFTKHVSPGGAMARGGGGGLFGSTSKTASSFGSGDGDGTDRRDEIPLEFEPQMLHMSLTVTIKLHAEPRALDVVALAKTRIVTDDALDAILAD